MVGLRVNPKRPARATTCRAHVGGDVLGSEESLSTAIEG
jgi:hypothetical protein